MTYQPATAQAITQARSLLAADHGALATQLDGGPLATRVGCLWIAGVGMTLLMSDLSDHARALDADDACALLLGEVGKGDPVAHPRLTLRGRAVRTDKARHRDIWLAARPKTALYFDFEDFHLRHLTLNDALLVAGFGRAHRLTPSDL